MKEKIVNCYDSHTHFWATGQVAEGLKLHGLINAEAIKNIEIKQNYYRANWLVGFGWNQHNWSQAQFPHKKILDAIFPEIPVFLSRVDGHAAWINSKAIFELKNKGYDFSQNPLGGIIGRDSDGEPNGILFDQAHINALILLPDYSELQNQYFFEKSQSLFNRAGFTHVRDLSMNLNYWQILLKMEQKKNLTLGLEAFITVENIKDLNRVLNEIKIIKKEKSEQIRLQGVKIFIDGSLGSKTAYLSQNYNRTQTQGLLIWAADDIKELLRKSWQAGEHVAIHTIGDQAAHIAVGAAREVSAEGFVGRLHLEHVQLLRPETIQMMKPLHVTCHLQPCHWLSDKNWIKDVISTAVIKNLFPWEMLRKNNIPFFFGSDSPIEIPSLLNNKMALEQSADWGIPRLNANWKKYHAHPDQKWLNCYTELENDQVQQVYFNKVALL